jgi:hypothetical protein
VDGEGDGMTLLRFDIPLKSSELQGLDVPIEIRDSRMKLIQETTASQKVRVESGFHYVITARLPAGHTITDVVKAEGDELEVKLVPEEEEEESKAQAEPETSLYFASMRAQSAEPPPPLLEKPVRRRRRIPSMRDGVVAVTPALPMATMRFFSGNLLARNAQLVSLDPQKRSGTSTVSELFAPPANECRFLQCAHAHLPPVNIALPVSAQAGCVIVVRRETSRYWIDVQPAHQHAKLLLGYAENQLAQSEAALATQLVLDKFNDPIAAAVGAYSLLRVAKLRSETGGWLAVLMREFPWLPDGAAARGEHLARWGQHGEALSAFAEVSKRGLPLFSDGIRYTYERLRFYSTLDDLPPGDAGRAREALERIKPFVKFIDFTKGVTTFLGADPNHPGPSDPLYGVAGMNVASLFA